MQCPLYAFLVVVIICGVPRRQVRNNQVPKPRAMVEDILARVTLLDAELGTHTGPPPSPTSSMGSPTASGTCSQVNIQPVHDYAPTRMRDFVTDNGLAGMPACCELKDHVMLLRKLARHSCAFPS